MDNTIIIVDLLSRYRLSALAEAIVQDRIEAVLVANGRHYVREHRLRRGPIDFYLPDMKLGIEVKVKGGPSDVMSQLLDYADDDQIASLVLVTTKPTHSAAFTPTLRGKPAGIVHAWKGF